MAPDRASHSRLVYALIFGSSPLDSCHDHGEHAEHEHRCPLCHGLPGTPEAMAPDLAIAFRPHDLWRQGEALRRAAQARNINHSSRAPPQIA
ncbi:hypothetical protein LCM17_04915 [Cereibacter sphaeroides]|nr:hypothetical protein [Cereibacter sphaeroides]